MNNQITYALAALNQATHQSYTLTVSGGQYTLHIPAGGSYPEAGAYATLVRLTNMRIAAEGRAAIRQPRRQT